MGVKFTSLDDHLLGSLDWYVQNRTQLSQGAGGITSVMGTVARGAELEMRYVATPNISFTLAANLQHTTVKGPDHSFAYVPARTYGVTPAEWLWRQLYRVMIFRPCRGAAAITKTRCLPHAVISPYVTWTSDAADLGPLTNLNWGATFGGTYVGHTQQTVPDPIVYPVLCDPQCFGLRAMGRVGGGSECEQSGG